MNVDREKEKLRRSHFKVVNKRTYMQIVFIFGTVAPSAVVSCTCQVCLPVYRQTQISMQILKYQTTNKTLLHKISTCWNIKKGAQNLWKDSCPNTQMGKRKRSELKLYYYLQVQGIFHNPTNHLLTFLHTKQPATNHKAFKSAILVLVFTFYSYFAGQGLFSHTVIRR